MLRPRMLLVSLAAALVLALAIAAPHARAADTPTPPARNAATKQADAERSAAERRAASSEFEREKLDSKAFTEDSGAKGTGADSGKDDSGGSLFRFLFGLVVVLAVIYGVHWLLKRWGQNRMQGAMGTSGIIDVVATTPLAQGRALHVVRVGQELVLVGATEQSITRITDLNPSALSGTGEFADLLDGALVGAGPTPLPLPALMPGSPSPSPAKEPFAKRFLDNLRMSTAR